MKAKPPALLMLEAAGREWRLQHGDVIGRLGTVGGDALRHFDVLSRQHLRVEHAGGSWHLMLLPNVANETLWNGAAMTTGSPMLIEGDCSIQVADLVLRLRLESQETLVGHPVALVTLDAQFRLAWHNPAFTTLLGQEHPTGTDFYSLLETGAALRVRHVLMELRDGVARENLEAGRETEGGMQWLSLNALRSGEQWLLSLRDITHERQQRDAVKQAADRLDERVGALTTLLTAASFVEGDLAAALPLLVQDVATLLDETEVSVWLPCPRRAGEDEASFPFVLRAVAGGSEPTVGREVKLGKAPSRGEASPMQLAAWRSAGLIHPDSALAWMEPLDGHGVILLERKDASPHWSDPEIRLAGLAAALGRQLFANFERRETMESLRSREAELSAELGEAAQYVERRLPGVLTSGHAEVDWIYQPCGRLGGDSFGYEWLDEQRFAIYIVDVMGHGSRSSLHALSLSQTMKLLLARGMEPDPAEWLGTLNREFPMRKHQDLLWTMWCGLYDRRANTLQHASGGHPPALLCYDGKCEALATGGPVLGAVEEASYRSECASVPDGAKLFLYTDGTYEFPLSNGDTGTLEDFTSAVVDASRMDQNECAYLKTRAAALCAEGRFPDDFTVVRARFTR